MLMKQQRFLTGPGTVSLPKWCFRKTVLSSTGLKRRKIRSKMERRDEEPRREPDHLDSDFSFAVCHGCHVVQVFKLLCAKISSLGKWG